jgi:hypothetical protein
VTAPDPQVVEIGGVIQLAVAPVFLLAGIAGILNVLTGRLARVVDRARRLEDAIDAGADDGGAIERQLLVLGRRARLMNRAITLITLSALLVAVVVITLFLSAFFDFRASLAIASLFILAMVCLTLALLLFLREVFLAFSTLRIGLPGAPVTGKSADPR